MSQTIRVINEEDLNQAIKIIENKGLVSAHEPYEVLSDPAFSHSHIGRWNFKKPNTLNRYVVLHLVYPPKCVDKIRARINPILNK